MSMVSCGQGVNTISTLAVQCAAALGSPTALATPSIRALILAASSGFGRPTTCTQTGSYQRAICPTSGFCTAAIPWTKVWACFSMVFGCDAVTVTGATVTGAGALAVGGAVAWAKAASGAALSSVPASNDANRFDTERPPGDGPIRPKSPPL